MVLGVADYGDPSAVGHDDIALGDISFGVIGSLGVDVGFEFPEEVFHGGVGEEDDVIDAVDG